MRSTFFSDVWKTTGGKGTAPFPPVPHYTSLNRSTRYKSLALTLSRISRAAIGVKT